MYVLNSCTHKFIWHFAGDAFSYEREVIDFCSLVTFFLRWNEKCCEVSCPSDFLLWGGAENMKLWCNFYTKLVISLRSYLIFGMKTLQRPKTDSAFRIFSKRFFLLSSQINMHLTKSWIYGQICATKICKSQMLRFLYLEVLILIR